MPRESSVSAEDERTDSRPCVCWVLPDVGHYHVARIRAFAMAYSREWRIVVIELSDTGGFPEFRGPGINDATFELITLFRGVYYERISVADLRRMLWATLDRVAPHAVLIQGWAQPHALEPLRWCVSKHIRAILVSESQERDAVRSPWREAIKRLLVAPYSSGLVGGQSHADYLARLGMARERIFTGYDVVDNRHFADGADAARRDAGRRRQLGLPDHYFLATSRFIDKKNLRMLIDAYAQYLRQTQASALADAPWHLVLLGDGGLRPALEAQRRSLGLEACIHMPGFKSYGELPAYYGLADGFVHASLTEQWGLVVNEAMAAGLPVLVSDRCGCVADLVREGENGFTFSPGDKEALVARMTMLATGACNREAMKGASRAIVAKWNVGAFAKGLQQALGMAMSAPTPRIGGLSRSTMWLLMRWQACTED